MGSAGAVVEGLPRHRLRARVRRGEVTRVAQGLYVEGKPTPLQALQAIQRKWPDTYASGQTAVALWLGKKLAFPLHIATSGHPKQAPLVTMQRQRGIRWVRKDGVRVQVLIQAAALLKQDEQALSALEEHYAGKDGQDKLEKDAMRLPRLRARERELIRRAATSTDSKAEVAVVRALKARGLKVESNVQIGPYRWDIVLPELKVAVEINGWDFHSRKPHVVRDHWKNNDAALRGWLTLRYTGSCVTHHLEAVVEQIASARRPDFDAYFFREAWAWHQTLFDSFGPYGKGAELIL